MRKRAAIKASFAADLPPTSLTLTTPFLCHSHSLCFLFSVAGGGVGGSMDDDTSPLLGIAAEAGLGYVGGGGRD